MLQIGFTPVSAELRCLLWTLLQLILSSVPSPILKMCQPDTKCRDRLHSLYGHYNLLMNPSIRSMMSNLTRNEVRQLRQWSHEQDFRHDIVGMLPLELVIQILQEVDLRTAFRSRRVSKKWAMVLSSSHIVEAILRPWLSRDDPGLHTAEGRPSQTASSIMAEHIDAFCTGRPFSELTVICNASEDQSSWQNLLVYSNGIVSWYDESSGEIIILPLKSGVSKTWVNQNREKPYAIALSEDLLAASTSSGRVFIYNHRTGDEYRIRLSSGYQRMILLRGGTLAILHGSHVTTVCVFLES